MSDNPYEELDLDASLDLTTLTEILRERAEGLDAAERARIQGLWQALTVNARERARHAVLARPRVREARGVAAALGRAPALVAQPRPASELLAALEPLDLALPPTYTSRSLPVTPQHPLPEPPLACDPFFAADDDRTQPASRDDDHELDRATDRD